MIATERVLGGMKDRVFDDELDRLKRQDLPAFAATVGYSVDCQESSGKWIVLRRDGDKLLASAGDDGRWLWRSARDSGGGSVIDFAMHARGINLGQARKELREWASLQRPIHPHTAQMAVEAQHRRFQAPDRKRAMAVWLAAKSVQESAYLAARGISAETQARFAGSFRVDGNDHVIFPLRDALGKCGYERRWHGLKVIGRGSVRGLWSSPEWRQANQVLIVESPIDAMSHSQLYGNGSGYFSVGGQLTKMQIDLLKRVIDWCKVIGKSVVCGTDNDNAGWRYWRELEELGDVTRLCPVSKDWNDDLQFVLRESG